MIGNWHLAFGLSALLLGLPLNSAPALAAQECVRPGNTEMTVEPWAQTRLGVSGLAESFQGWGVTIAVIGSGVDSSHPQLAGHVTRGLEVGSSGDGNDDCYGAGTATAGAAAAAPVSGSTVRGLAPEAVITPIKLPEKFARPGVSISDRDATAAEAALIDALESAADLQADIVVLPDLSLASTEKLRTAVAEADQAGMLLIQGLPSGFTSAQAYPLAYPEVLGIQATGVKGDLTKTEIPSELIDLAAPGTAALALAPGKGYTQGSAFSLAAGFSAGAAALLIDAKEETTPAALRKQLIASGTRSPGINGPPLLSPAAALGPIVSAPEGNGAIIGGELFGREEPGTDYVPSLAVATALFWVAILALSGWSAAALIRGRRRRWIPAEHNKPFAPNDPKSIVP